MISTLPYLAFADKKGTVYSHPFLRMAVSDLSQFKLPTQEELIRLPKGSAIFYLPGRTPIGFNPNTGNFEALTTFEGKEVCAVAASLIPAYVRLYHPAAILKQHYQLPLWAYTAAGCCGKNVYVTSRRIDIRTRHNPHFYDTHVIREKINILIKRYPQNRLIKHFAYCALNYNCLTARHLFLARGEAPVVASRHCNASCLGCLSRRGSDCLSSHARINFIPNENEIIEVMKHHLRLAAEPIISFGQGCEGEPLLEAERIASAIKKVREQTARGTINMNTNASLPKKIELLCRAGIDSFRVSLNSPRQHFYQLYFRPRRYSFKDVLSSIAIAKKYRKFVSVNLFVFPGFSDTAEEIKALKLFIKNTGIDMIQWRNLNIDPAYYAQKLFPHSSKPLGVSQLLKTITDTFPYLKMGYFNLPKEQFASFRNVIK
ncbi:MAG: radical SAM protein [Candidatus Omnitrophota bacterium]